MDIVQVNVSAGSRDEALSLARSMVEAGLAACAQVMGPMTSVYRWQGAVEQAEEWLAVFKTTGQRYAALEEAVKTQHSYDVPEIICLPITTGSPAYLEWVEASTASNQ